MAATSFAAVGLQGCVLDWSEALLTDASRRDLPAPDRPGLDLAVDLPLSEARLADRGEASVVKCDPNAFLSCEGGSVLLLCGSSGNGTVLVDCSPYLCDAVNKRCTQCDPKSPPTCQGTDLLTCTADGLLVKTTCPSGCANGSCTGCTPKTFYKDGDGDGFGNPASKIDACVQPSGYVLNSLDCDDLDAAARPGQTAFFNVPTKGAKNFDYNCDKVEQMQDPSLANCVSVGQGCQGDGWVGAIPACGQQGTFGKCSKQGGGGPACGFAISSKIQSCH